MRGIIVLFGAGCLAGCDGTSQTQTAYGVPASCNTNVAESAARKTIVPILNKIAGTGTRKYGCLELDGVIKDTSGAFHYDEFKPNGCDWDYGETGPYEQTKAMLEPLGNKLAKLCDWERKDAERSFEQRGEQILQGMSPEDRDTLQRAYEGR